MNHYNGIINNPVNGIWLDQSWCIGAAGMAWGVVRLLMRRMTGSIVLRYRMRYLRRFQQKKGYGLGLGVMTRNPLLEISRAPLHFTLHMPNGLPVPKREQP